VNARATAVSRPTIFLVALAVLALSLYFAVRPTYAIGGATLHEPHVGTNSATSQDFPCEGQDPVPPGEVLWHFILNGLDPGITDPIPGVFEFTNSGTVNEDSSKWNNEGTTHHFYVFTVGDDILEGATADIGDSEYNNFVLSHICHGDEVEESVEESVSESVEESVAESEAESAEQSIEAGTGTPAGSQPDTAGIFGGSNPLPTVAFSLILLASLAGLAFANVKGARSRS